MIIYIVNLKSGKTMPLGVEKSEKICEVKRRIGVPLERQILTSVNGETLDNDDRTLKDYNINNKSQVFLDIEPNLLVLVKYHNGDQFDLYVEESDTISMVKVRMRDDTELNPFEIRLSYAGELLDNHDRTLSEFYIHNGSTFDIWPDHLYSRTVFVESCFTGEEYPIMIKGADTLTVIQSKFTEMEEIPQENQHYFYMGQRLLNGFSLIDRFNLQDQATILQVKDPSLIDFAEIYVFDYDSGKQHTFEIVLGEDTVKDLKEKIEYKLDIPEYQQKLYLPLKQLDNPLAILSDYGIHHKSTIFMVFSSMKIYVETPEEEVYTLDVERGDTILAVKSKIEDQEGIPEEHQVLMFFGECLDDNRTLESYDIGWGYTLTLELIL